MAKELKHGLMEKKEEKPSIPLSKLFGAKKEEPEKSQESEGPKQTPSEDNEDEQEVDLYKQGEDQEDNDSQKNAKTDKVRREGNIDMEDFKNYEELQEEEEEEDFERENKVKNMHRSKYIIHPDNVKKTVWDLFGFFLILYTSIAVPYSLSFEVESEGGWLYWQYVIDVFFIIDVVVSFNCGYFSKGILHMKRKDVTMNYLKGWFILDVFASFPYTWVVPDPAVEVSSNFGDESFDNSGNSGGSGDAALKAP
jgi:Ion transport protein